MGIDITEIKQSLSTLVYGYLECATCSIVDNDFDRVRVGALCSTCGKDGTARMYFNINIHILVDMIQESFHTVRVNESPEQLYQGGNASDVSVVLFFCTLREALLDNLISRILITHDLSDGVANRLLVDNKFYIQKQNKLFQALTGVKWQDSLKRITTSESYDYLVVDEFITRVVSARNSFIHEGSKWSIDSDLPAECLRALPKLARMYVALHNEFVRQTDQFA